MKVELTDGRIAQFGVKYADTVPSRAAEMFKDDLDFLKKFRSVTINLTIWKYMKDGLVEEFGWSASSFCNPNDRFIKRKGRARAMQRLLRDIPYDKLSKEDRKILCPVLLYGRRKPKTD